MRADAAGQDPQKCQTGDAEHQYERSQLGQPINPGDDAQTLTVTGDPGDMVLRYDFVVVDHVTGASGPADTYMAFTTSVSVANGAVTATIAPNPGVVWESPTSYTPELNVMFVDNAPYRS